MTKRHKTDWDYVEWLLGELNNQLLPRIAMIREKRPKIMDACRRYCQTENGARKRREYSLRYVREMKAEIAKRRAERKLMELEAMEHRHDSPEDRQ